jgi:putative ABC transport system permease protein
LGIGLTTAIYSAAYELVLRPAVMGDANRVVDILHRDPIDGYAGYPESRFSLPDFDDLRSEQTRFSHVTAWYSFGGPIIAQDRAEVLAGEMVDGEYFEVAGVRPALGRLLQSADNMIGVPPVAVISYAFWERWFGSDPAVVGRLLKVGELSFEIIGVTEAGASPSLLMAGYCISYPP